MKKKGNLTLEVWDFVLFLGGKKSREHVRGGLSSNLSFDLSLAV